MVGPSTRLRLAAALALGIALSACRSDTPPTLTDIASVEELKARFNRDAGKPRTVLLLSPT